MRNYGISLLKIIAAFAVVWAHFGLGMGRLTTWAVPSFVLISFWLTSRVITEGDGTVIKKRVQRIVIPFFILGLYCMGGKWCFKRVVELESFGIAIDSWAYSMSAAVLSL